MLPYLLHFRAMQAVIEYPELEGTYKDPPVQTLAPLRTTQKSDLMSESVFVQTLELWQA